MLFTASRANAKLCGASVVVNRAPLTCGVFVMEQDLSDMCFTSTQMPCLRFNLIHQRSI